jgi:hypothetical protein
MCSFHWFLINSLLSLTGCSAGLFSSLDDLPSGNQGGDGLVLELPFESGVEKLCTQGVGGFHSHRSTSTFHDLDLDTDNTIDEEIFAPASGVARVHMESATSGFGYHVNIDQGDGTYVVIAHLSDIFISDGDEVAAGSLMGYEGCTGECTGDHVHIGLHEGDAGETADQGISIPVEYRTANQSDGAEVTTIAAEDFSCGIRSLGDFQDGDTYESQLATNLWHPDGTLVKTPDNVRVYVLEDGEIRWIENETTFLGLQYDFQDVTLVSSSELDCYGTGSDIAGEMLVDAAFDTQGDLWLIVGVADDSDRYRAPVRETGWEDVMDSWGLDYSSSNEPETYADGSSYMSTWPPISEYVGLRDGTLVKESDASDVFIISGGYALPVQTWDVYLLMNHYQRDIQVVDDGMVGELHTIGNCATDELCIDLSAVTTCGGGLELGDSPGEGGDGNDMDIVEEDEEDSTNQEDLTDEEEETSDDSPSQTDEQDQETQNEEDEEVEEEIEDDEEETSDQSVLSILVDYPADYPSLTLTVQPIFAISSLGDYWLASVPVTDDDEVSWSDSGDYSGLLGVRFNVNVDTDGDGTAEDWYCYGHYETAYLEYGVAVDITLDSDSWDENDLVTWSPGEESDTSLGCSALLWFGSTNSITDGAVY